MPSVEPQPATGVDVTWVTRDWVTCVAIAFAMIAAILSAYTIRSHLVRFDYPKLQILAIRIILMVPIYAVLTSCALIFPRLHFFFVTARDAYESFALYIFFMLMIAYCGGEGQLLRSLASKRYMGQHPFPLSCLPFFPLDTSFYLRCKRWVLQCAIIKPLCSFIALVGTPLGIYKEGNLSASNLYPYVCVVMNISLTCSLYYLVLFEVECKKELHYAKTFLKFLCVKSIIFFSYWQSIGLRILLLAGVINTGTSEHQREEVDGAIQSVLLCLELLPVAILFAAAFGRKKLDVEMSAVPVYMKNNEAGNLRQNLDTALNVNDIIDDTLGTIFYRRGKLVDQENKDGVYVDYLGGYPGGGEERVGHRVTGGGSRAATDPRGTAFSTNHMHTTVNEHDPTLSELVRHAIATDYGVRTDGVLHFDEDSDREERNADIHFTDHDVMLHRSRHEDVCSNVCIDTDLLLSQEQQSFAAPQVYCVVCGRFDREMVRRKNGYKCKVCVGTKSQPLLSLRQQAAQPESGEHPGMALISGQSMWASSSVSCGDPTILRGSSQHLSDGLTLVGTPQVD